jgi:hypothetical protein
MIVSDNGTEFTSNAMSAWARECRNLMCGAGLAITL